MTDATVVPQETAAPPSPPSDAMIVVPTRNMVLFPEIVFPVSIGRPMAIAAAQQAVREQRQVLLLLQKDPALEEPGPDDFHAVGTVANVLRYITDPEGGHHIICQGVQRFRVTEFTPGWPYLVARGVHLPEPSAEGSAIEARTLVLRRQALEALQLLPQIPPELTRAVTAANAPQLADLAAAYMDAKPEEKQEILEAVDLTQRLDKVTRLLSHSIEVLKLSQEIGRQTKASLDERQREVLLREQLAAIQRELGEGDGRGADVAEL